MNLYCSITHFNKRGKIKKNINFQSRSFLKVFMQWMFCAMSNYSVTTSVIDITNSSRSIGDCISIGNSGGDSYFYVSVLNNKAITAPASCGIVLGTGSTAVAVADYKLETLIANGTAATQLKYYGCWGYPVTSTSTTSTLNIERLFENVSGGTITISEAGIYGVQAPVAYNFCFIRDLVSPTISVLNGEYLKVIYSIQTSI